jgi:predicted metal-dependent phosphoesterase TrpH
MLGFQRSKRVGVWTEGHHRLVAHGILEDDIYGLEVRIEVDPSTREVRSVKGWWNRWTTPDCPLSAERIQDAVGVSIDDPDLARRLQRSVGRRGCRHFANILIECCHTAREAIDVLRYQKAKEDDPGLTFQAFLDPAAPSAPRSEPSTVEPSRVSPEAVERRDAAAFEPGDLTGPFIDLHVHTAPASPCSSAPVDDLIQEAMRIGLGGICLTDHNCVWSPEDVEALRQKHGFLVLRGNEIITDQGDVVVFGLDRDIRGITRLEELREEVVQAGGFMIAAHPFRGFLTFGVDKLGLTAEKAMERKLFRFVDGVEILNGKVTEEENRFAGEVARGLGRVLTGGSDAHEVEEVGQYATRLDARVRNEQELIEALRTGRTAPVAFRAMNRADREARP